MFLRRATTTIVILWTAFLTPSQATQYSVRLAEKKSPERLELAALQPGSPAVTRPPLALPDKPDMAVLETSLPKCPSGKTRTELYGCINELEHYNKIDLTAYLRSLDQYRMGIRYFKRRLERDHKSKKIPDDDYQDFMDDVSMAETSVADKGTYMQNYRAHVDEYKRLEGQVNKRIDICAKLQASSLGEDDPKC